MQKLRNFMAGLCSIFHQKSWFGMLYKRYAYKKKHVVGLGQETDWYFLCKNFNHIVYSKILKSCLERGSWCIAPGPGNRYTFDPMPLTSCEHLIGQYCGKIKDLPVEGPVYIRNVSAVDRMFLVMQDFDFAQILLKFAHILDNKNILNSYQKSQHFG